MVSVSAKNLNRLANLRPSQAFVFAWCSLSPSDVSCKVQSSVDFWRILKADCQRFRSVWNVWIFLWCQGWVVQQRQLRPLLWSSCKLLKKTKGRNVWASTDLVQVQLPYFLNQPAKAWMTCQKRPETFRIFLPHLRCTLMSHISLCDPGMPSFSQGQANVEQFGYSKLW